MKSAIGPESPCKRLPVVLADLDGDGVPEMAAAYIRNGKTGLVILKSFYGIWQPIAHIKGKGGRIHYLKAARISRMDKRHLVIGWQDDDLGSRLEILEWTGESFANILGEEDDRLVKVGGAVPLYPAAQRTSEGAKWGYLDNQGRFVIQPQYDSAMDFQDNGLAIVGKPEGTGLIDRSGRFVVPPVYSSILPFYEGRAAVIDDAGFKVIDQSGTVITPRAYSFIGNYQEGRALYADTDAQGNYLYGYLDRQGKAVIPLQYESANNFIAGRAVVKLKENQFALIGLNGEVLHTYHYGTVGNLGDGLLPFQQDFNSKYGYIDIVGNVVLPPKYAMALPFDQARAEVNLSEGIDNQYGLIDPKGNFIIPTQYNYINRLGENRAAVGKALDPQRPYLGSKYAIADIVNGALLTDFIYTEVNDYSEGYASAATEKKTFFIDQSGKIAKLLPVVSGSGTLSFTRDLIRANIDMRTYYMDRTGKVVWHPNYIIPLANQYKVIEGKYKPNMDYLVYYPEVSGMKNSSAQKSVNNKLKKLSKVKPVESSAQLDYSYTGDFSVEFFKKDLLVLQLSGYNFPFGAAHGMPTEIYPHIDLANGSFYRLKDLFKPGSNYVKVLSDIIGTQIKNIPEYSYVFPDAYKGIKPDQPFYVKEDALYIYFEPYEIAPYAAGFPTFRITYAEIIPIIYTAGAFWKAFH